MDLKLIENYLNDNSRHSEFSKFESLPTHKINNRAFFRKKEGLQGYLVHFTKLLGFDCRPSTPLVLYKAKGYISISKEKSRSWNKSYKNRNIVRHYSSYLNRSRYLKITPCEEICIVDKNGEITKIIEPKKRFRLEFHPELDKFYKASYFSLMTPEQKKWTKKTITCGILKFNNLALREYPNSEIVTLDIDTHGEEIINPSCLAPITEYKEFSVKVLNELKSLPLNILLFERSKIGNGIHVYIKLDGIHNKEIIKNNLKKILESKFPLKVEFRTKTKALRLPFAYDYEFVNTDTLKIETKLKKKMGFVIDRYKLESSISNRELTKVLDEIVSKMETPVKEELPIMSVFKRDCPKKTPVFVENKFSITDGNRVGGSGVLWDIAFYSLRVGYDVEKFIDLAEKSNISSKDLTSWDSSRKRRDLESIYDFASSKFIPNFKPYVGGSSKKTDPIAKQEKYFVSNVAKLSDTQKRNIEYVINDIYYEKLNKEGDSKWLKATIEDCKLVFPELVGKILFEKLYPRDINESVRKAYRLRNSKVEDLKTGYQFPKEYLRLLKKHYPTLKRDISVIFTLFKNSFLERYVHKTNGKTTYVPTLKSCTQYIFGIHKELYITESIDSLLYNSNRNNNIVYNIETKHTDICYRVFEQGNDEITKNYIRDW